MNVRLRMYKVLLFKFGRYLCKGSIDKRNVNQPSSHLIAQYNHLSNQMSE